MQVSPRARHRVHREQEREQGNPGEKVSVHGRVSQRRERASRSLFFSPSKVIRLAG
jgi:hypothetical protein